jgi:hypothetical protein
MMKHFVAFLMIALVLGFLLPVVLSQQESHPCDYWMLQITRQGRVLDDIADQINDLSIRASTEVIFYKSPAKMNQLYLF